MDNRTRLLAIKKIIDKYSDINHHLSNEEINSYLFNEYNEDCFRKVISSDFKALQNFYPENKYVYKHKSGYYSELKPFSFTELKILIDSLNAISDIDEDSLNNLNNKLLSFASIYQEKYLNIPLKSKHPRNNFFNNVDLILKAIAEKMYLQVNYQYWKEFREIRPLYLLYDEGHYYLLHSYPQDKKKRIYSLRLSRIKNLNISSKFIDEEEISLKTIQRFISNSKKTFNTDNYSYVKIKYANKPNLIERLKEDFINIDFYPDYAIINTDINSQFFSLISSYQKEIEIVEPIEVRNTYKKFLNDILTYYL